MDTNAFLGTASGGDLMRTLEFTGLAIAPIVSALIAWKVASRKKERRRIEPNPLPVRRVQEKATEDNCKERYEWAMEAIELLDRANADEHRRIHDKIGGVEKLFMVEIPAMERRLDEKSEERSGNIHDRVNEILEAVGEVRGQLKPKDKERGI